MFQKEAPVYFKRIIPVLKSYNIAESKKFYAEKMGFDCRPSSAGSCHTAVRGGFEFNFKLVQVWETPSGCWIEVAEGIESLFEEYLRARIVKPDGLKKFVFGTHRFDVVDPAGNIIRFFEEGGASARSLEFVRREERPVEVLVS